MKPPQCAVAALLFGLAVTAHSGVDDLRITEVNVFTDQVEVTNFGMDTFTTTSDLRFCYRPVYPILPSGTMWGPGESKLFTLSGLTDTDTDLWLYRNTSYNSSASIITGLAWGNASGNLNRLLVAVAAGIWPSVGASVPNPSAGQVIQLQTMDPTDPVNWTNTTDSNLGSFFGTGAEIMDPLPDVVFGSIAVELENVAEGFVSPLGVVDPDDGSERLLIYDQVGNVHILQNGALLPDPFLSTTSRQVPVRANFDERGLIGFCVAPDFATSGKVYTHTSEPVGGVPDFTITMTVDPVDHHGVIAEWTVDAGDPNMIDTTTRRELLRFEQPQFNHDGGQIAFGSDNLLYIGIGDGGNRDDEPALEGHGAGGNGQNGMTVLGSILRIDPSGSNSANGDYGIPGNNPFTSDPMILDEIFAYGLRNPYQFSFVPGTSSLIVADVGQNDIEEVDVIQGGENLGWRLKEGTFFFDPNTESMNGFVSMIAVEPVPADVVDPIAQYDHGDGRSIIGGYVYLGTGIPGLQNRYVFADWGTGFNPANSTAALFYLNENDEIFRLRIGKENRVLNDFIKGTGQDASGDVYICTAGALGLDGTTGRVLRIVPLLELESFTRGAGGDVAITVCADPSQSLSMQMSTDGKAWSMVSGVASQDLGGFRQEVSATLPLPLPPSLMLRVVNLASSPPSP